MSFFDFLKTTSTPKYKDEVLKIEISEVKKILNKFLRDHKYEDCSFKIKSIEILDREYENSFILKIVLISNNTVETKSLDNYLFKFYVSYLKRYLLDYVDLTRREKTVVDNKSIEMKYQLNFIKK